MPSETVLREDLAKVLSIGDTPLVPIRRLGKVSERVRVYGKAEWLNPGGSVKDRPAVNMVRTAIENGSFPAGKTLLDASSGNTGIAYAWIGARLGFPVKLAVPASINHQRRQVLEAYGVELVLTSALEGSDGAIRKAKELYEGDPDRYFYPDQYNNPENWKAHYKTTGPEIFRQTGGSLTHFVAGLGTTGTFRGTAAYLREKKPEVRLISVQPDSPLHGLEGLKHLETAIVPGIYDPAQADEEMFIETEKAQALVREVSVSEGLLLGPSGGANLLAALTVAERLSAEGASGTVVTIFPDSGERYLAEAFWGKGS